MRTRAALLLLLCACDDHLIGDCSDPAARVYEPIWGGVTDLFGRECAACHAEGATAINLETAIYDELADGDPANDFLVVPGSPDTSILWQALVWSGDVPTMPAGAQTPLAACKIEHVREWIESGASLAR